MVSSPEKGNNKSASELPDLCKTVIPLESPVIIPLLRKLVWWAPFLCVSVGSVPLQALRDPDGTSLLLTTCRHSSAQRGTAAGIPFHSDILPSCSPSCSHNTLLEVQSNTKTTGKAMFLK